MIGYLSGIVRASIRDTVIIDTGPIGYRVHVPASTLARMHEGDGVSFWTHFAVRENTQDLYGFETREELQWFELLLTVSSIGPRSALAILNSVDAQTLEAAIAGNDASTLTHAFGIGRKTAEKIVLELREKVSAVEGGTVERGDRDVVEALLSLGYSLREARDTARAVPNDIEGVEARIREALRIASSTK